MTISASRLRTVNSAYVDHLTTTRGALRVVAALDQLVPWLPVAPGRVLDVGAGDGVIAAGVAAAGHEIVLVDPDEAMLALAAQRPELEGARLVRGDIDRLSESVTDTFDVVICHGVLMYLEDSAAPLDNLERATKVGGLLSLITKNRESLPLRAARRGEFGTALELLDASQARGHLGVDTRGDSPTTLFGLLQERNFEVLAWYGIRAVTDHVSGLREDQADWETLVELERKIGALDPYRLVAPLVHFIARRVAAVS